MAAANIPLTNLTFFEALLSDGVTPSDDIEDYHESVKEKLKEMCPLTDGQVKNEKVQKFVESFTTSVRKHWKKFEMRKNQIYRKKKQFYSKEINFQDVEEYVEPVVEEEPEVAEAEDIEIQDIPEEDEAPNVVQKIKSFTDKSKSQQIRDRRKVAEATGSRNAVLSTAVQTFYQRGKIDSGYVLKQLINDPTPNGEVGTFLRTKLEERKNEEPAITFSPEEAWAVMVDRDYSVRQYTNFQRDVNQAAGRRVYPGYKEILAAREKLRPPARCFSFAEDDAIVELQGICDNTAEGIFKIPGVQERGDQLCEENGGNLDAVVDFKMGTDGFNGATKFRQIGAEASHNGQVQASHFVVLQITAKVNGKLRLLYTNPLCNSPVSCRLLRFWYVKETEETLRQELNRLLEEREFLDDLDIDENIKVSYNGILSLLDQKALNALVGNRCAQRCPLCGLLPREYLRDGEINYQFFPGAISYLCLSILHFGLRTVENLLKIGYHKYFKQNCCYAKNEHLKDKAMKEIQQAFLTKGLRVSMVCKNGGTTNTGKFFYTVIHLFLIILIFTNL